MKSAVRVLALALSTLVPLSAIAQEEPAIAFEDALADTANWREVPAENLMSFRIMDGRGSEKGTVLIEVADFSAPGHKTRFVDVVKSGDLNGTVFHRVIDGFMAQGGDIESINPEKAAKWENIPGEFTFNRDGSSGSFSPAMQKLGPDSSATDGYILGFPVQTQSEYLAAYTKDGLVESWIPHCKGVVSTARTNDPNSASTQFFLMRDTTHDLDRLYTAWGRIVDGQDVVDNIKTGEPVKVPDMIISAKMVSDMPEDEQPRVLVQRTDGPVFAEFLAANAGANVCDLPAVPSLVSQ